MASVTHPNGAAERYFRERIDLQTPDECDDWPFAPSGDGYGTVTLDGRRTKPHVAACEVRNGPRPNRMEASHTCHRKVCWNQHHLIWETHAANMRRSARIDPYAILWIKSHVQEGRMKKEVAEMFGITAQYVGQLVNHPARRSDVVGLSAWAL